MEKGTKRLFKDYGFKNADRTVHMYMYLRFLDHYIHRFGSPLGLTTKAPEGAIPSEIEDLLDIYTGKILRDGGSRETSTYHGKVMTLENAEAIIRIEEDIDLGPQEGVVPYTIANEIVINNPDNIVVFDCVCRSLQEEPCSPRNVCMSIGDPVSSFLLDSGKYNPRKISKEEALQILREEHERGHVHNAFFKDAAADGFYMICNCCSCCCVGMLAHNRFGVPIIAASGYVAKINDNCTGCGICESICPFDAITMNEIAVVDEAKCMGCGVCLTPCTFDAIEIEIDPDAESEPLDIVRLVEQGKRADR